jgi:hypothetical protein
MANQQANALINSTMETFNGDTTSISTIDGISLIDTWLSALRSGENDQTTNPIANTLSALKTQLQEDSPNAGQLKALLNELADQTENISQSADDKENMQLNQLVQTLRDFGKVINGEGGSIEDKHGRGQIFTQTGTGSAAGNPGVNPAISGNAGTGDDGNVQGGGSYGSGYGTGSSGESGTSNSGTDSRTTRT